MVALETRNSFATRNIEALYRVLQVFEGRQFSFQGTIKVERSHSYVRFITTPLEWITLEFTDGFLCEVTFTVNDADDRGQNWKFEGPFDHVLHLFRGYIAKHVIELASPAEILSVLKMG